MNNKLYRIIGITILSSTVTVTAIAFVRETKNSMINPENPMSFLVHRPMTEMEEEKERERERERENRKFEETRKRKRGTKSLSKNFIVLGANVPWKGASHIESQIYVGG